MCCNNPIFALLLVTIITYNAFGAGTSALRLMTLEEYKSAINYTEFTQGSGEYFQSYSLKRKQTTCNAQFPRVMEGPQNAAIAEERYRWKNLYIHIDEAFDGNSEEIIIDALSELFRHCCFKPMVLDERDPSGKYDYVFIRNGKRGSGCNSEVGKQGGEQVVNLESPDCIAKVPVIHEMMHALGYWHEHSRPDRDDYITIRTEYVIPRQLRNFDKVESSLTFNLPYDQNSVMHYQSTASSIDGVQETIVAKNGKPVGNDGELTPNDIEKLRIISGCVRGLSSYKWRDGRLDGSKSSTNCKFQGSELISFYSTDDEQCGELCSRNENCRMFNWRPDYGGTCSLLDGNEDSNPIGAETDAICGFVDKSWKQGIREMVSKDKCEFYDPNVLTTNNFSKDRCEIECLENQYCTKYSWNPGDGGTCSLKKDSGSFKPRFGANLRGSCGVKWKWKGNFAKWNDDCDFKGGDITFINNVNNETCADSCSLNCDCVRFTWRPANNGTCWLKNGYEDSFLTVGNNKGGLCGYLNYKRDSALKYGFCSGIVPGFDTAPGSEFDLKIISISSLEECCLYCKEQRNCQAFVFNNITQKCHLKKQNYPKVFVGSDYISGSTSCTNSNKGNFCHGNLEGFEVAPGKEFTLATLLARDVNECCDKCVRDPNCKAFVYSRDKKSCLLKNVNTPWVKRVQSKDMFSGLPSWGTKTIFPSG